MPSPVIVFIRFNDNSLLWCDIYDIFRILMENVSKCWLFVSFVIFLGVLCSLPVPITFEFVVFNYKNVLYD